MQQKSSWADLQNDPMMKRLAILGKNALDSGAVSKDQAAQWASSMGITDTKPDSDTVQPTAASMGTDPSQVAYQGYNPLAIGVSPGKAQSPVDMTAGDMYNAEGVANIGDRKGAKASAERSDTTTYKRSSNRYLTKNPDQIRAEQLQAQGQYPAISSYEPATDEQGNPQFDHLGNPILDKDRPIYDFNNVTVDEKNPVRMQEKGVDQLQGLLGMDAEYQKQKNHMDFTPLAALADAVNAQNGRPTNLAASATKPDQNNNFMAYADEIQKRRADIQKSIAEGVRAQRGGTTMDMLTQALLAKDAVSQSNPTNLYQERLDSTAHQATLRYLRNDKNLRDKLVQYQNISNALNNYASADVHTPQQFDELQQAVRANLGIKGSSGVGERERTQLNSLGLSADRIGQILTGKPADVKNADFDAHIKNLASLEGANIKQQYSSRLNAIAAGNGSMYARRPDLASDLQEAISANAAQVAAPVSKTPSRKSAPLTQAQKATTPNPQPNAKPLEQMSNDELKAYIKQHGGS